MKRRQELRRHTVTAPYGEGSHSPFLFESRLRTRVLGTLRQSRETFRETDLQDLVLGDFDLDLGLEVIGSRPGDEVIRRGDDLLVRGVFGDAQLPVQLIAFLFETTGLLLTFPFDVPR